MNKKQIAINDLCIYLNRKYPLCMLSMMEIYPENTELTRIFSKWFKSVWCFGKWTDEELALNCVLSEFFQPAR